MFKLELQNDADKLQLLREVGSRNPAESQAAQQMLAVLVQPVAEQVLDQMSTSNAIYRTFRYDFDNNPSIPLDLFEGNGEGLFDIWSQSAPGGLPTNHVHGMDEFRMTTFRLDSAVEWLKRYARDARLDVLSLIIQRLVQEVLIKQEANAWAPILKAIAEARTSAGDTHIIDSTAVNTFQVDDVNRLWTKAKRLISSFVDGTPASIPYRGITDLVLSPEMMEQVRAFAYQPMNTRAGSLTTSGATAVPLPEKIREQVWNNGGIPEIFGLGLIELLEMGVGKPYSVLFNSFYSPGGGDPSFSVADDEIILGVDLTRDAFVRALATDADSQSSFIVQPDDQYPSRSEKSGLYGYVEEGWAVIDSKALTAIIV